MMSANWIRALAVTALLASACGSIPKLGTMPSPSASPSAAVSPSANPTLPIGQCPPPSKRCLALVTLRGSSLYVVRDITDIAHPRTVGKLGPSVGELGQDLILDPVFVSASEVSYTSDDVQLFRMPLDGSPKTSVTLGADGHWSPDGNTVVYLTFSSPTQIGLWRDNHQRVLGSMPDAGGGGCETLQGCSLPNWLDFQLAYSPDGTVISLVVNTFSGSYFRLWSSAGELLKSSDGQGATMSTWSGRGLYFRDAKGVEVWQDGVVSSFLPGVAWVKPKGSPDGTQIVFTVRDSSGWGHIRVVDTTTKHVRVLKSARTDAVFLTSRFIWYEGERACVAADVCGAHPPTHPLNDKTYIYDLQEGTETESIITGVADVWPHAA
jgi:hypothetical protein